MSGKYMKIKRVIIPTLTMVLLSSMLFGCSAATKEETYDMLQQSTEIELEYAVPEYDADEDSKVELLPWLQLSSLETHPELRTAFEELLGITKEDDGTKSGIVYTDENGDRNQNNTLYNALGNTNFTINYIRDAEQIEKIEEIANSEYTDIEDNQGVAAVINAYFELLPDQADGQFDGSATISRAQAMTLVMRATTPVNESQKPDTDEAFTSIVGDNTYTDFAAPMNQYSYINTDNGLTDKTFNTTMSRGEYIYLLTNTIFNDDYTELLAMVGMEDESLSEDVKLTTVKDGGDISLQEAINNVENGLPTDMYNTLARAVALGFIDEDNLNWDEAITKSDAITLFIDATEVYCSNRSEAIKLMFGIEDITSSSETSETVMNTSQPYYPSSTPCGNSQKKQAWNNFCENWNESDYGTTTKGKCENDFPYYGNTGYDVTLLEYRTTDKGYTVFYDTATGRVYYTGMTLPTGNSWDDITSGGVLASYEMSKGYNGFYDVTYAEMQEVLGVYNGD